MWQKLSCLFVFWLYCSSAFTQTNNKEIHKALYTLQKTITHEAHQNPDALATVLTRFNDEKNAINFDLWYDYTEQQWYVRDHNQQQVLIDIGHPSSIPADARPSNVPEKDWLRFVHFWTAEIHSNYHSENGNFQFSLIDLNEDGERDLVIRNYIGGTGLYSQVSFFRYATDNNNFTAVEPMNKNEDFGFSINDRGGDQDVYLLKINNKSYIGYRDSYYVIDKFTLYRLNSLQADKTPLHELQIYYRYTHQAIPDENTAESQNINFSPKNRQLIPSINRYFATHKLIRNNPKQAVKRCPIPKQAEKKLKKEGYSNKEIKTIWPWNGPGHYTFETPVDFPIYIQNTCYSARIINYLGGGSISSRYKISCTLQLTDSPLNENIEFALDTKRHFIKAIIANNDQQQKN